MLAVATVFVPRRTVSLTVAARSSVKRIVSGWRALSAPAPIAGRPRTGATATEATVPGAAAGVTVVAGLAVVVAAAVVAANARAVPAAAGVEAAPAVAASRLPLVAALPKSPG